MLDSVHSTVIPNSTPVDLKSIDRLIENGHPKFGVFKTVKHINYLNYYSYLISQKRVSKTRKQFKANQFAFVQIIQPPYRICIAVATIKLASSALAYIYNENSKEIEVVDAVRALNLGSKFEGDHQQGTMAFKHSQLTVSFDFSPNDISLKLNCKLFNLSAVMTRSHSPLAICTPSGRRGWTFTQKEPFQNIVGKFKLEPYSKHHKNENNNIVNFNEQSLGNLDWTLGYMRHQTNWFWACLNTQLQDGRQLMLNLSMGVNETGASENAMWINGEIVYLPPVMFIRQDSSPTYSIEKDNVVENHTKEQIWHVYNQNLGWSNVEIDLTFTPITVYKKTDDYGIVASIFEQWIGFYSGTIKTVDEVIELDEIIGLSEDHFAKW